MRSALKKAPRNCTTLVWRRLFRIETSCTKRRTSRGCWLETILTATGVAPSISARNTEPKPPSPSFLGSPAASVRMRTAAPSISQPVPSEERSGKSAPGAAVVGEAAAAEEEAPPEEPRCCCSAAPPLGLATPSSSSAMSCECPLPCIVDREEGSAAPAPAPAPTPTPSLGLCRRRRRKRLPRRMLPLSALEPGAAAADADAAAADALAALELLSLGERTG